MVAALISYNYQQDRAQLVRESIATARAMMSAVDRDLAGTQAALLALATSPHLASNDLSALHRRKAARERAGPVAIAGIVSKFTHSPTRG